MVCPFVCAIRHAIERTKCKENKQKNIRFLLGIVSVIYFLIKKIDKWTAEDLMENCLFVLLSTLNETKLGKPPILRYSYSISDTQSTTSRYQVIRIVNNNIEKHFHPSQMHSEIQIEWELMV